MSLIQIKLIGETIKEYLLCLSIVLAGVWAFYSFSVTERQNIHPQPIVESTIKVKLINSNEGNYVKSEVTLQNKGNNSVWVELKGPSLSLSTIDFTDTKTMNSTIVSKQRYEAFLDNAMLSYSVVDEMLISPKSKIKLMYLSAIPETEDKFVQVAFMATYRHRELRKTLQAREHSNIIVFTTQAREYVSIK